MNSIFAKIKYIFPILAYLAAACSSDSPDVGGQGAEMLFAATEYSRSPQATTRSASTSSLAYDGSQFAVYGDMKGSTAVSAVFTGTRVTYSAADSKWAYTGTQYWFPGFEYSFVGVHPAGAPEVTEPTYALNNLTFAYSAPANYKDTKDLLVATHRRVCESKPFDDGMPAVTLKFAHALTRLNFLVKCDGAAARIKFTEVTLQGVNRSGSLSITPAPLSGAARQTDDYTLVWRTSGTPMNIVAPVDVEVENEKEAHLFPADNALLVLPQPDNNSVIVKMAYTLYHYNGKSDSKTLTAEAPIGGWQPGKIYTYSLLFEKVDEPVVINVSVNDWTEGTSADVSVPRK